MMRFVFCLLCFVLCTIAYAGDTIVVNALAIDGKTIRIGNNVMTLWGIDAPNEKQTCMKNFAEYPCGQESRTVLQKMTMLDNLKCTIISPKGAPKQAKCFVGQHDLASLMVESGWAFDDTGVSGGFYAPLQAKAERQKSGVWQGQFAAPVDWRAGDRFMHYGSK